MVIQEVIEIYLEGKQYRFVWNEVAKYWFLAGRNSTIRFDTKEEVLAFAKGMSFNG